MIVTKGVWVPLTLLFTHALFNLIFSPLPNEAANTANQFLALIAMGVFFSQLAISALWGSLTLNAIFTRIPTSIAAYVLVTACMLQNSTEQFDAIVFICVIFLFLLLTGTFLRYWFQFVLSYDEKHLAGDRFSHQFSMRYLLFWTAVVSILLTVGRILGINLLNYFNQGVTQADLAKQVLDFIGIYLLMLTPAFLAFVLPLHGKIGWLRIIFMVGLSYVISVLLTAAILESTLSLMTTLRSEALKESSRVIAGMVIGMLFSTYPLRWAGYRIVRQTDAAPSGELLLSSS